MLSRVKFPLLVLAVGTSFPLLVFFYLTDVITPVFPSFPVNAMESTGLALLMGTLPAYLLVCLAMQERALPKQQNALKELLPEQHHDLLCRQNTGPFWWLAGLVGLIFAATSNINWHSVSFNPADEQFWWSVGITVGQFILWGTVGLVLYMKLYNSFLLNRMGQHVHIDLFNTEKLNCFGRAGINELLIVVGAMAFSPLQSIDQSIRWVNYQNTILVGVPAAILLLLIPIWSVHVRILQAKRDEIRLINAEIDKLPKTMEPDSVSMLNSLLDRRNYVQNLRSWPMDLSIFSRIVLYVLIPPLAWIGAAVMESVVDVYLQ